MPKEALLATGFGTGAACCRKQPSPAPEGLPWPNKHLLKLKPSQGGCKEYFRTAVKAATRRHGGGRPSADRTALKILLTSALAIGYYDSLSRPPSGRPRRRFPCATVPPNPLVRLDLAARTAARIGFETDITCRPEGRRHTKLERESSKEETWYA